jgi:hypothetical protein
MAERIQLSEAEIERLRQSGIRLDGEGRFWHEGEEVRHAGLRAAFWRWLDRNPDGRYVLRLDERRFVYLDVDDAPHRVRSLRWEGDRAWVLLADGAEEELDYATVHLRAGGAAYCKVKGGRLEARLSTAAWGALADRLLEGQEGAVLQAAGTYFPIGTPPLSPGSPDESGQH